MPHATKFGNTDLPAGSQRKGMVQEAIQQAATLHGVGGWEAQRGDQVAQIHRRAQCARHLLVDKEVQ